MVEAKGQRVRGRLYPWGIVEGELRPGAQHLGGKAPLGWRPTHCLSLPAVENQAHCDFVKLRNMLIRTHMHDLKDVTCDVHYENYRAHCIQQMTRCALRSPPPQSCPEVQELQGLGILGRSAQPPAVVSLVSTLQQADPGQPHGEPHPHPATAHPRCRDGEAHQDEG